MKQSIYFTLTVATLSMLLSGCFSDKRSPGWEYMPDMAHSLAYDAYTTNPNFADDQTSRQPVKGTVPLYQGVVGQVSNFTPYPYANTPGGYDSAGSNLRNPIISSPDVLHEGERLYTIYCAVCHGMSGKGDGSIVVNDQLKNPFPPPPSYFTPNLLGLSEGKMFHTVRYGKNLMGSYASQVDQKQAWTIIHYVKSMQQNYIDSVKNTGTNPLATASADTTKN